MDVKNPHTVAAVGGVTDRERIDMSNDIAGKGEPVFRGYAYVHVFADGTIEAAELKEPGARKLAEPRVVVTPDYGTERDVLKNIEQFIRDTREVSARRADWKWTPNNKILPAYEAWCYTNSIEPDNMQTLARALRVSRLAERGTTRRRVPNSDGPVHTPQWGYYLPPLKRVDP